MKVPLKWLSEYIDLPQDTQEVIRKLTSIGHMQDGPPKEIAGDSVYDLEIRQNRSDCLSLIGIAREAGAVLNVPLKRPVIADLPPSTKGDIEIQNPDLCYRFETVRIENIVIGESPEWLKQKLEAYGVKSINNVVDITNFVMIEMGEPMHAYDADKIQGPITIRTAHDGEKVTVLGARELELTKEDLVIADSAGVLALAGVIGGEKSSVSNDTKTIILEDATYNQATIRRTSIRHQVRTEASTRHEKFLHPSLTTPALARAAELIKTLAQGVITNHTDVYGHQLETPLIHLDSTHIKRLSGIEVSDDEIERMLTSLEIEFKKDGNMYRVSPPYFRTDLNIEEDIIEEIVRIKGYDSIPEDLISAPPPQDITPPEYIIEDNVRDILTSLGFDEEITEPLTYESAPTRTPVMLENSLNSNKTMLRTTLQFSLLHALENKEKYQRKHIKLFEVGKIYYKEGNDYKEDRYIGIIAKSPAIQYVDIKGQIETLFKKLHKEIPPVSIEWLGNSTFFCQFALSEIIHAHDIEEVVLSNPPQIIYEDLSLIVPLDTKVGEMLAAISNYSPLVYDVQLGETPRVLDTHSKTVFIHLSFSKIDTMLTSHDTEEERMKITARLKEEYNATVR